MKISVSGKGGVGKTTISAGLSKLFSSKGNRVYAIDCDPDVSLGLALGFDEDSLNSVHPLVELKEEIDEKMGGGDYYPLNPKVDDVLDRYSLQKENINFLRMGSVKQGGSACYCRENSFMNALLNALLLDKDDIVILDMAAGIEHLTRGTASGVDLLLIVTEPTRTSIKTSQVVKNLGKELGIRNIKTIINKLRTSKERELIGKALDPKDIAGVIEYDEEILEKTLSEAQQEAVIVPGLEEIFENIEKEVN